MVALTINDEDYGLDRRGPAFLLTKQSSNKQYTVHLDPTTCTCPAFRFRNHMGPCKHGLAIRRFIVETVTKEQVEEAEFTATEAPTAHLPAVVPPAPVSAPGRTMVGLPRLTQALVKAQASCQPVEKESYNAWHKYNYASAEVIIAEGKAALNAHGLALLPIGMHVNGHDREGADRFELEREFLLSHDSGESVPIKCHWPICPDKGRPLDKATASADTTSLAYTYRDLLAMPRVNPEDDVNARDDTAKGAKATKPASPQNGAKPAAAKQSEPKSEPKSDPYQTMPENPGIVEPRISADDVTALVRIIKDNTISTIDVKALLTKFKAKNLESLAAGQYQDAVRFLTGNLPITPEQQQRIRTMIDEQKIPAGKVKAGLHDHYRVESLSQLKQVQAINLIERLKKSAAIAAAPTAKAS